MTKEQQVKIRELRMAGKGYKLVAAILGLTRDSVRNFCKRNGLDGNGAAIALNIQEKVNRNILCTHCHKPLKHQSRGRSRRFCSDLCRRRWWHEHQKKRIKSEKAIYHYTCGYCGKVFSVYGNKNRKYCSHHCYIRDRFWREEENDRES